MLTGKEAAAILPMWGSFVHNNDPGACFYAFPAKAEGRPVSEAHRKNCLAWIDGTLLREVLDDYTSCREAGADRGAHQASKDWRTLILLRRYLMTAPLYVEVA